MATATASWEEAKEGVGMPRAKLAREGGAPGWEMLDGAKVEEKRSEEAARARKAAGWGTAERGALVRGMSALEVASTGTAVEGWEGE